MSLYLLNYYFFKDSLKNISYDITSKAKTDNNTLFKFSFFYNSSDFYNMLNPFKKDPYRINRQIKTNPNLFFKEILMDAKISNNENNILFTYAIILSYYLNSKFNYYIKNYITKTKNIYYVEKMIDSYFFNKFEKLSLHKINIADYFFDGFIINDNYLDFLDKPLKRSFGLFCTKKYYTNCYQNASKYYDKHTRSKTGLKKIFYLLNDILLNHRKNKRKSITYLYHKKIDTTILNLNKKEYEFEDKMINLSLDEFYDKLLKDVKNIINAINIFYDDFNIKPFLKLFPITD